jgi:hypothetical protein
MLVEQSLEAKIAAEKIQLNALEGHVSTVSAPASSLASTSDKSNPSISAATPVASAHADKMAQDAMIKALKSVHVPRQMKSKLSSDIKKVRNVLKADQLQKEALAKIEMKISTLQAAEAQDKASLADVSKLQAKLKGAAQILSSRVQKDASKLQGFIIKQDQLASAVRRDEVRDQKLKSLVSAISKKKVLLAEKAPVKTTLFQLRPVILTELAQSVAVMSHNSQPTDLTFTSLAAESVDSIKAEITANEASLASVQKYIKTVDSEERAFRKDLEETKLQEKPIRAGLKAMADI